MNNLFIVSRVERGNVKSGSSDSGQDLTNETSRLLVPYYQPLLQSALLKGDWKRLEIKTKTKIIEE